MKDRILRAIFDRYFRWRIEDMVHPQYPVILEYRINPQPRYGYGKPAHPILNKIISCQHDQYKEMLKGFLIHGAALSSIAIDTTEDVAAATFANSYFSGLDAAALYSIVATKNPETFFEVGSGYSTRFVRRAIQDNRLRTRIVSCDPEPRAEITAISDEIIREPFESIDLSLLDKLKENDVLFFDSSHRCFMNSDVTVQFMEAIPRIRGGVFIHIHDILLPYDYPLSWSKRHYSEQYLLAAYLLGGGGNSEIILPLAYVSMDDQLTNLLTPLWELPGMAAVYDYTRALYHGYLGFSFWLLTRREQGSSNLWTADSQGGSG